MPWWCWTTSGRCCRWGRCTDMCCCRHVHASIAGPSCCGSTPMAPLCAPAWAHDGLRPRSWLPSLCASQGCTTMGSRVTARLAALPPLPCACARACATPAGSLPSRTAPACLPAGVGRVCVSPGQPGPVHAARGPREGQPGQGHRPEPADGAGAGGLRGHAGVGGCGAAQVRGADAVAVDACVRAHGGSSLCMQLLSSCALQVQLRAIRSAALPGLLR